MSRFSDLPAPAWHVVDAVLGLAAVEKSPRCSAEALLERVRGLLGDEGCWDAAVALAGPRPELVARGPHAAELLDVEGRLAEGPLRDGLRTGSPHDLLLYSDGPHPWPRFTPHAQRMGIIRITTLPLPATEEPPPLGALVLYRHRSGALPSGALRLAQTLADAAAVALRQHRDRERMAQLEQALSSRIVIEQAKGMLAERHRLTPDQAFDALRRYARAQRRAIHDLARAVVQRGENGFPDPPEASEAPPGG